MLELMLDMWILSIPVLLGVNSQDTAIVPSTEYVQYIPGDINLIISVPHDGRSKPKDLRNRRNGVKVRGECDYEADSSQASAKDICKVVLGADLNSKKIGLLMAEEYKRISGNQPHMVIANLHRSKVDFNRDLLVGAQSDPQSQAIHKDYHGTIAEVRKSLKGPGLLIDLHGQNHGQNSTELGYLYKKAELNSGIYTRSPSVRALMKRLKLKAEDVLFGSQSLGGLFEKEGYRALPSPRQPRPGKDKYYRGGFTTQTYGSRDGGDVDAIQIEVQGEIRLGSAEVLERYSKTLARVLRSFFEKNY